jgi:hypothetical protein
VKTDLVKKTASTSTVAVLTGDEVMDDMLAQTMKALETDRKEADDLFEMIRNNAEQTPDDPGMAHSAVQALKLKQNVTAQATRVMDIAARYKMQREKMLAQANQGDRDSELLEMIEDEKEKPQEEDKEEKKPQPEAQGDVI